MTREATRVSKRTVLAIEFVRKCIVEEKVTSDGFEDYINDVAHVVYNRPGIEGHCIREKVKTDIYRGVSDVLERLRSNRR